eukprot:CAMPEP_0181049158 /NCGR_PEP_ID=MMETSP1070-20121207/15823_1 /TAXON_ID=265543 /ORGANISM="Minutocellus polymorphus, Strain NH13" /LENGTH=49 /DNA_ID= /DNA_START= /DNA_END= /DNA_ORIENTATION=
MWEYFCENFWSKAEAIRAQKDESSYLPRPHRANDRAAKANDASAVSPDD